VGKGFVPDHLQWGYTSVIMRGEFCNMAVNWVEYATGKSIDTILSERGLTRTNPFTDISDSEGGRIILAAYALGITAGTSATTFTPFGEFTREQAATMIMNTVKVIGADIDNRRAAGFGDINNASSWAHNGINYVSTHGIMAGTGSNNFSPKATFTREQSIVTFNNINHTALPKAGTGGGTASTPSPSPSPRPSPSTASGSTVPVTIALAKPDTQAPGRAYI
jgi:hypothetical protein